MEETSRNADGDVQAARRRGDVTAAATTGSAGVLRGAPVSKRRRRPPPATPYEYLEQMPALILLDRLPTPMLAVGLHGDLVYANPALAVALGYSDVGVLAEQPLPMLLLEP